MKDFNIQYLTGDHAYVFRFDRKDTAYFLQYIGRLAASSEYDFDWYDVANVAIIEREQRELFDEEQMERDRLMQRVNNRVEHIL